MSDPKIMLIAGEASGDRIAAAAIRATKKFANERGSSFSFFGIGGDECDAQGVECLHTAKEMSVVGFVEVARRFRFFRNVLREMTSLLDTRRPDTLLLIDYPGFNIRLAREAKKRGIRVVYYVSPQVWAWHASRIKELKEVVDEMLVIFPFEEKIYRDAGFANTHFVGHPLVERIDAEIGRWGSRVDFALNHGLDPSREWLLVFPGSRSEEVRRLLPTMTQAAIQFTKAHNMQAILVQSASIDVSAFAGNSGASIISFRDADATHELMHHAKLGILKSGTTTLEAALIGLPGVICYKTHPLTFAIGKRLVKLKFIGLANIVLGRKLYPELLQGDVNPITICEELDGVMKNYDSFKQSLEGLSATLRQTGATPSRRVAEILLAS